MATKNYSISLPIEIAEWFDKNDYISLSKITQASLNNIRVQREEIEKELLKLKKNQNNLINSLTQANQFITDKGLWEEFIKIKLSNTH